MVLKPESHTRAWCYKYVQIKCRLDRLCFECQIERRKRLYGKIAEKLDKSGIGNNIRLWTFGTNYRDNRENRARLQGHWVKFRAIMSKYNYKRGLFRVTEAGSKGGFLHIHMLYSGYILHNFALRHWRRITGISSNVNLSSYRGNSKKAINYTLKYMTKGSKADLLDRNRVVIKYSWMGLWYKIKFDKYEALGCRHGEQWKWSHIIDPMPTSSPQVLDTIELEPS